ncbi:unnamed protein product [Brachionus calyciflorus]|uniref:Uncharacterized protein n=1 Tax=Brachionus calyciflorus TaxID=104777 RepID=A0A814DT42_9BILA|nr:unnamed protein product [Brachionus calyciflorus]
MIKAAGSNDEKLFKKLDRDTFEFKYKKEKYRINLFDFNCSCVDFMDRAHLVYLSHSMELDLGYYNGLGAQLTGFLLDKEVLILGMIELIGGHSAENIRQAIEAIVNEYDFDKSKIKVCLK